MKKEEAKKWLKKNIKRIQHDFGLEDWSITFKVMSLCKADEHIIGLTYDCLFKYKSAKIDFYTDKIKNIREFERTVRHEFYHVLLSPLAGFIEDYRSDHKFSDDAYTHVASMEELTVWNLEQHFKRVKR